MIYTDKYEGHKTAPWRWFGNILLVDADNYGLPLFELNGKPTELDRPDEQLITDAPLLLAEVKRLREGLREIVSDFEIKKTDKWEMLFRIETILKGDEEE